MGDADRMPLVPDFAGEKRTRSGPMQLAGRSARGSRWRAPNLAVQCVALRPQPLNFGEKVKKIASLTALSAVAVIAACSSTSQRSGFESAPADGSDGGSLAPPIQNADAGNGPSCATAQAAAIKAPLDIIVVVDQSGSMSEELTSVKQDINQLSSILATTAIDYRLVMIGTVGTGTYEVCVPPPLGGPGCASNGTIFRAVDEHIESNDALKLVIKTLTNPTATTEWASFLRPNALKVFIPVTDDDSKGSQGLTAAEFDAQLIGTTLFGTDAKRNYTFYPIIGAAAFPSEAKCGTSPVNTGPTYIQLAKMTNGKWFPICGAAFASAFAEMGKTLAAGLSCELSIPAPKEGDTLDPDRVNVKLTSPDGKTVTDVLQDKSAGCDAGANGWQYSADGTKVLLCGDACEAVRADPNTKIDIEFGCQTKVK